LRKLLLTGFVVFFYEGSALQLAVGLGISFVFAILYSKLDPYLMPSNNTFASYVHFQISVTFICSLLLRMESVATSQQNSTLVLDSSFLSVCLLLSNGSVLLVGILYIVIASFNVRPSEYSHLDIEDYLTKSLKNGGGHQTITQPPHNDYQESKIDKIMNNNEDHGEDDDQPPHFNQESSSSSSDPKILLSTFHNHHPRKRKRRQRRKRKRR